MYSFLTLFPTIPVNLSRIRARKSKLLKKMDQIEQTVDQPVNNFPTYQQLFKEKSALLSLGASSNQITNINCLEYLLFDRLHLVFNEKIVKV